MQLVKATEHADDKHSGSVAIWKQAFCDPKDKSFNAEICKGYSKSTKPDPTACPVK